MPSTMQYIETETPPYEAYNSWKTGKLEPPAMPPQALLQGSNQVSLAQEVAISTADDSKALMLTLSILQAARESRSLYREQKCASE